MAQAITLQEINSLRSTVNNGQIGEAYTWLADRGYKYALLARGVAQSDSLSGTTALTFMDMQYISQTGDLGGMPRGLEAQIKVDMANGYLDVLQQQAERNGVATLDVTYQQTWDFHTQVFNKNGLSASTWTLDTPFSIMKQLGGDAACQSYWQNLLAKGENFLSGTAFSASTQSWMANQRGQLRYLFEEPSCLVAHALN